MRIFSKPMQVVTGMLLISLAVDAQAALLNGSILTIDAGSNFGIEISPGFFLYTDIVGHDGLITGSTQAASGAHAGAPDGTESPGIDKPWEYFTHTGMHWTSSPTDVLSSSSNTATLDFSGWNVTWNNEAQIPLGVPGSVAEITCGTDCSVGDTYSLYYSIIIPNTAPGAFALVAYELNLVGNIMAIPIPASIWLFGSGVIGLIGVARRKKS